MMAMTMKRCWTHRWQQTTPLIEIKVTCSLSLQSIDLRKIESGTKSSSRTEVQENVLSGEEENERRRETDRKRLRIKSHLFTPGCRGCRETRFANELSSKQTFLRLLLPSHRVLLSQTSSFLETFVRLYFLFVSSTVVPHSQSIGWKKSTTREETSSVRTWSTYEVEQGAERSKKLLHFDNWISLLLLSHHHHHLRVHFFTSFTAWTKRWSLINFRSFHRLSSSFFLFLLHEILLISRSRCSPQTLPYFSFLLHLLVTIAALFSFSALLNQ